MLTRDKILQANDLKSEVVNVPEWGGEVTVRTLTGDEKDAYVMSLYGKGKKEIRNIRAGLLARAIVGEDGKRLFTDADVLALGAKSAAAIDRVYAVASRLNAMTKEDEKQLEKNLGAIPTADSSSDLPLISE
jgi:hypothetical protein